MSVILKDILEKSESKDVNLKVEKLMKNLNELELSVLNLRNENDNLTKNKNKKERVSGRNVPL